jgi:two-component system, OmpR family, sensor kinase
MTMTTMTTSMTMTTDEPPTEGPVAAAPSTGLDRARRALSSIRVRVVLGYVGLLLTALVISLLVTRQLLHTRLDRQIERDLAQEVEELRSLATGNDPATGEPFNDDAEAIFDTFLGRNVPLDGEAFFTLVDGQPHKYSLDPPSQLLSDGDLVERWSTIDSPLRLDTATADGGEVRTLAVPLRAAEGTPGVFVVAAFPRAAQAELDDALRIIAMSAGIVLLVTAAAAWAIAERVVRPVRQLTDTALRISDSDTSARIPVAGHDELAELGLTFNAMLDRLEAGVVAQRQFLDDIAHELRTPLTIARGHLEVSGPVTEDQADTFALVMDELDRMGRYVDDLLLLAKSEQQEFLRLGPVDVGDLVQGLLTRASALGERSWVTDEAPRAGVVAVVADAGRLEQALLNLMTNAAQHTAEADEIGIGARAGDGRLHLWVRDTGPGVPAASRDRIFDRMARGANSRVSRPDGTGIGLAIVTAIVRAHHGTVTATETPGGGATFTIDIPLDPEATS